MKDISKTLKTLLAKIPHPATTKESNRQKSALLEVTRYRDFLQVTLDRWKASGAECYRAGARLFDGNNIQPGLDIEQQHGYADWMRWKTTVQLDIESFYLFAKILLDKLALLIQECFGTVRGIDLKSHDRLVKRIGDYLAEKGIGLEADILASATELKVHVSDHRDYQIAHVLSNPQRGISATGDGKVSIVSMARFNSVTGYPTTKDLDDLLSQIDSYVIDMIEKLIIPNAYPEDIT